MANRRRQVAEKARRPCEEERKEPGSSKRQSTEGSRSKKLSRGRKAASPASTPVTSRSEKEEENCSSKKTPQLLSKCKQWDMNSPSRDAEQHHDIFWDPNSPTCFKLENGRKKAASKCTVEISDIVNRIAPKDVKPTNSDASYFGVWIGDDAIPCTPLATRTRSKLPRTRILKTEEMLMELAKRLDRNLVEDKEQNNDDLTDKAHEPVANENDGSFLEYIPEEEEVSLALKSVSQNSVVGVEKSSQKSVDQETEEALNHLFDCSTQKYSGRLSQGLSNVSTSSIQELVSDTVNHTGNNKLLVKDKVPPESNRSSGPFSFISQVQSDVLHSEKMFKQPVFSGKEPVQCATTAQSASNSQDDFGDDWGDDMLDDSFVMQITQNPELIATPKSNFTLKTPKPSNLDTVKGKTSTAQVNNTNKLNNFKCVTQKVNESEGSKMNTLGLNRTDISNVKRTEETTRGRTNSSAHPGVQVAKQTVKSSINPSSNFGASKMYTFSSKPLNSRKETDELTKKCTQAVQQSHAVSKNKESAFTDEWDDPKFSDEVLDMFCESDSLWDDKDNEDDDLLYQVCDDVERLTQVQASEGNAQFSSSNHNVFTKIATNNKSETHMSTNCSFVSNKPSGNELNSTKIAAKGVSPASVSGNCSISFPNSSFQRTTQTFATFSRSNSMPSSLKKVQEPHTETKSPPQATTTNIKNSNAPSKYTFTRTKPSPALSVHTESALLGNEITSKGLGYVDKRNPCLQTHMLPSQQSAIKRHFSESTIQSPKVFVAEDRSKKCSMAEIERKKQEALARRKMRERVCSSDNAPT